MDTMVLFGFAGAFGIGGGMGALIMWLWNKSHPPENDGKLLLTLSKLEIENNALTEKLAWVENAEAKLREAFEALASQSLRHNAEAFLKQAQIQMVGVLDQVRGDWKTQKAEIQHLIGPVRENLTALDGHVRILEEKREGAYQKLGEQLNQLVLAQAELRTTTVTLSEALRSSSVRGQWGEMQLRRVVEMAGMQRHVAFEEQVSVDGGRPDMIVHLPNGGVLPVDAKAPLTAYMEAMEMRDAASRQIKVVAHAKAVQDRVKELSQKHYWDQFERAPDFVVMFVPIEACLGTAFEAEPGLLEFAIERKVLIATPITLLALLKAVAYGWQQHAVTENARQIAIEGKELYSRLEIFMNHLGGLGRDLNKTVENYNKVVGSLDRRVIPSARRFREMGVAGNDIEAPAQIETQARHVSGAEGA